MASARHVVLINQPIEAVFEALAMLQHVPRWAQALEDDEGVKRDTPDRSPRPFEITGYEPPDLLTLAGHIGRFEAVAEYSLDELALGTLVTCQVQVELTDVVSEADVWLATSRIEAAVKRSLERTKQILESKDAT